MKTRFLTLGVITIIVVLLTVVQMNAMGENLDFSDLFLPFIPRNVPATTGPSGVLYVFNSIGTTNGNAGGRSGMNAICAATDAASHFCTYREVENAFNTTGVFFSTPFQTAWLDNIVEDSDWSTGNCGGWTQGDTLATSEQWANIILGPGIGHGYGTCMTGMWVSCCKWMP